MSALPMVPEGHYRLKHVVRAEVEKVMTLRSTFFMLAITTVASLLVTFLVTNNDAHHPENWGIGFDPTQESMVGLIVAGLIAGVFGALLIAAEYASGTVRTTLSASPRRPLLLTAKLVVTSVLAVVFSEVLSFVSFFLGQAVLSGSGAPHSSLGSPGALRAIMFTGLFIALFALMSFGFGLIFRHTAAAIAAFAGVIFVLPLVVHAISHSLERYLPTNILTNSITATVSQGHGPFAPVSPGLGLLLMALYAAVPVAIGCTLFTRRDA